MTAEVVLMNREAVALAADSAATLTGNKIYNSANKLFRLAPNCPVGLMIYNNAHFMGIPWEVVIRLYRESLVSREVKSFPHLSDYAHDFIEFLKRSANTDLCPADVQATIFRVQIEPHLASIVKQIDNSVAGLTATRPDEVITLEEIEAIVNTVVENSYNEWSKLPDRSAALDLVESVKSTYSDIITTAIQETFEQRPLSVRALQMLREICIFIVSKDTETPGYTGLIFAGFGSNDLFPETVAFNVDDVLCNQLRYKQLIDKCHKISLQDPTAIDSFAQNDMVFHFIYGIHPSFLSRIIDGLSKPVIDIAVGAANSVIKSVAQKEAFAIKLNSEEGIKQIEDAIFETLLAASREYYSNIRQALNFLPKDELAAMAETLVTLTSFKRRISMEAETVGGPIDVAVISKKDGFIWISRKHYFQPELNYEFFDRSG